MNHLCGIQDTGKIQVFQPLVFHVETDRRIIASEPLTLGQ
jgi:hypothetical protein